MAISGYHHLTNEDRVKIDVLRAKGYLQCQIAQDLGKSPSTISRELQRNREKSGGNYSHEKAQQLASKRRSDASSIPRKMDAELTASVDGMLANQISPEQITGRLKKDKKKFVSHTTIYTHIRKDRAAKGSLYKNLRHDGRKYNYGKSKGAGKSLIPNRVDIDQRPAEVDTKLTFGHWEKDTVIGGNFKGFLVTMVERNTKFLKIAVVLNKTAKEVADAIIRTLQPYEDAVLTLTADNGTEFAMHEVIADRLQAKVYFAKPYCSWQRGLNEHTNGLIRQYFPKGTRFDTITEAEVKRVETLINLRPRKSLNFSTPMEAFKRAQFGF